MEEIKTMTPKELASRLDTSPKRIRSILRSTIQRDLKHKGWQLTPEQAKQVIKAYNDKAKAKEQKKQEAKAQKYGYKEVNCSVNDIEKK